MTYNEFKEFLARMVWREGDPEFELDLDNLIKLGEASISRDLKVQRMENAQTELVATSQEVTLPPDFKSVRNLYAPDLGMSMSYLPLAELGDQRGQAGGRFTPYYSITNRKLMLTGNQSPSAPIRLFLTYRAQIPDFRANNESWLTTEREYFDLYVYAVLKHTAPLLKDDERVPMWKDYYQMALASLLHDDVATRYPDGQLGSLLPEGVA